MNLPFIILLSGAVGLGAIGLAYSLAVPAILLPPARKTGKSPTLVGRVRSAYGGLFLGFALFFALGAYKPAYEYAAMLSLLVFMAGFALGRVISFVVDGSPSLFYWSLFAIEIGYAVAALYWLTNGWQHSL